MIISLPEEERAMTQKRFAIPNEGAKNRMVVQALQAIKQEQRLYLRFCPALFIITGLVAIGAGIYASAPKPLYAAQASSVQADTVLYLPLIRAVAASVVVPTVTTEPDRPTSTSTPTTTQPDRPTATSTSSPTATTQPEQPTATPTATTEPAPPDDLRFFVDSRWRTSSAAIAVDEQGGKHLAFHYYEPVSEGEDRPTYAVYLYCAALCDDGNQWAGVALLEQVNEVQLQLTSDGKPRLLIRTASQVYPNGKDFYYAACDQACTTLDGWTASYVLSSGNTAAIELQDDALPQRSFALDPNDRPRFVYLDYNYQREPDHLGAFYAFCDTQCNDQSNWSETRFTEVVTTPFAWETAYYMALAFTPAGQPRIATAEFFPLAGGEPTVAYFECNEECQLSYTWQRVQLYPRGGGAEPSIDLEIDANGKPHLVFYQEALADGEGKRLLYASCKVDNCRDPRNWNTLDLGLGFSNGQEPDLELDAQGQPRIAYALYNGGLGYSWCNANCESASANWQHRTLESSTDLQAAWPVAHPPHCDAGIWSSLTPVLVLDRDAQPHVAFDATYHARCWYDDPNDNLPPNSRMEQVMRAVRVIIFTQE
jgi:hypothetical protein